MDHPLVRSEGVTETLTAPPSAPSSWERFESLYRSSRDDVYAYVMTLLRDPSAAEDVTALAFERAYRRRRTFDRRRGRNGRGCSALHATRRSTSCAGAAGWRHW